MNNNNRNLSVSNNDSESKENGVYIFGINGQSINNINEYTNSDTSMYLKPSKIGSNETMKDILPDSLIMFLDQLFRYRKSNSNLDFKNLSIGETIMQCIHPKACLSFASCIRSHRT